MKKFPDLLNAVMTLKGIIRQIEIEHQKKRRQENPAAVNVFPALL